MSIYTKILRQPVVYWPPAVEGFDEFGKPVRAAARQLRCRWEDTQEQFVDAKGTTQVARAKVYIGIDVEPGGALVLGSLEDIGPEVPADALEIKAFYKVPNMKATKFLRTGML